MSRRVTGLPYISPISATCALDIYKSLRANRPPKDKSKMTVIMVMTFPIFPEILLIVANWIKTKIPINTIIEPSISPSFLSGVSPSTISCCLTSTKLSCLHVTLCSLEYFLMSLSKAISSSFGGWLNLLAFIIKYEIKRCLGYIKFNRFFIWIFQ